MKKIPDCMENPIDVHLINFFDKYMCDFFRKTGHTPNMITTYSLITGLISCYFLNKRNLILFSIFYFMSYFFDCADGYYARKYDMTTAFGDMYDHIKDVGILLLVLYITFKNSKKNINSNVIAILIVLVFLSAFHLSCQEHNCNDKFKDKDNHFFRPLSKLCSRNKDAIYVSKYFGLGTFTILFIIMICYVNRSQNYTKI